MYKLFNPDGLFARIMNTVLALIVLNVLWLLCCVPVVTAGASTAALYAVLIRMRDGDDAKVLRRFFAAYSFNADCKIGIAADYITFINKGAIALVAGLIGYHAARKDAPAPADHAKIILGSILGALTYVALYMLKTFVAGQLIDGLTMDAVTAKMLTKLPGSLMNAVFAFIVAPILLGALKPALKKAGLYEKL